MMLMLKASMSGEKSDIFCNFLKKHGSTESLDIELFFLQNLSNVSSCEVKIGSGYLLECFPNRAWDEVFVVVYYLR